MKQQHPDNIPLLGRFSSLETLKTQEKKIFNETSGYESIIEISSIWSCSSASRKEDTTVSIWIIANIML